MVTPRQMDLEHEMTLIKNDLEEGVKAQNYDVIDVYLDNAYNLMYYINAGTNQLIGFDISLIEGGPFIDLEYSRGKCELVGIWRGAHLTVMDVDNAVCEEILERLRERLKGRL
ncbi:MAG: hypothetical protein RXR03_09005 [Thermocladium sp.]